MSEAPDLSFVVVTDSFDRIARTVRHLRAQDNRDRIELVIVVPAHTTIDTDRSELEGFHSIQLVETQSIDSISWARVPGIRRATAPFVALGETHSFPARGWAEALLAAHAEGWDAVGPRITNANPSTLLSWVNLFMDYGPWIEPAERTEMQDLPGHNSSYRASIFEPFRLEELERLLEAETELHVELRRRGIRLVLEPRAQLAHTNVTRWSSTFRERFAAGQRFAAARARRFSWPRRLVYALGSPLIPFIRFPRVVHDIRRCRDASHLFPRIVPTLSLCLVVSAVGEFAGYLAGSGSSMAYLSRIELDKLPHLRRGDSLVDAST